MAHTANDCDETCRGCVHCYVATGDTMCDRICPHRATNHPPEDEDDEDEMVVTGLRISNAVTAAVYGPKGEGR